MTGILEDDVAFPGWWYRKDFTHIAFYRPETLAWIARALRLGTVPAVAGRGAVPENSYNPFMNAMMFLLLGVIVGVFSGLVGVGGGIIVVPALIYGFGFSQLLAQGTSTALLLPPIGVFAAYTYYKNGYVDVRAAALICAGFLVGGYFGAKIAIALPKDVVRRLFGGFLLVVSIKMLSGR